MGGLVTRQLADPPAFRAVVRHELAHLRNRDVDLTYATVSLWYAFLLVGVLPFALVVCGRGQSTRSSPWAGGCSRSPALVYLTRNAVLRAREVFADVRASVPDGPPGRPPQDPRWPAQVAPRTGAVSGASIRIRRRAWPR